MSAVEAFVEKPNAETASRYVAEGYLWNSGNFLFRADVLMKELERFEPAMASAAERVGRQGRRPICNSCGSTPRRSAARRRNRSTMR